MTRRISIFPNDFNAKDMRLCVCFESDYMKEQWSRVYEDDEAEKMANDIRNWLRNLPYQS